MKTIILTNSDNLVLVDDIDYDHLVGYNWQLGKANAVGSIQRCESKNGISYHCVMARVIAERCGLDIKDKDVDHVNMDIFDNRRQNLRPATRSQNMANSGLKVNNTSGFKGVSYDCERDNWAAYIMVNKKKYHLGRFDIPEEAARAYDRAARMWFGNFARTNFPAANEEEA